MHVPAAVSLLSSALIIISKGCQDWASKGYNTVIGQLVVLHAQDYFVPFKSFVIVLGGCLTHTRGASLLFATISCSALQK